MSFLSAEIRQSVGDILGSEIREINLTAKGISTTFDIRLADSRQAVLRVPSFGGCAPIVEAEVATVDYLAHHSSIPVSAVLAHSRGTGGEQGAPCYVVFQKPLGVCAENIFSSMAPFEQKLIIGAIAKWMGELLCFADEGDYKIGPVVMKPFYSEGRSKLTLDRGPFDSAKAYYKACALRELDSARVLFAQDAPASYQHDLEESRLTVERITGLLCDLTNRCQGLDEDDPDMAPLSLDIHDIGLRNVYLSPENHTEIVSVVDWRFVNTRPLWCCARLPSWTSTSMTSIDGDNTRFAWLCKAEAARIAGIDSPFLRALGLEDTRSTLDDLSTYDAFRDGFLLLPALENILATLPGHEDVAGLIALLDPSTLPGRVARINLLTRGSNPMYLAMTPPRSPHLTPVKDESTEQVIVAGSSVLVL
ncbi:hypothetical protein BD311DRAFT_784910 [Dichomitus squalens]|uniref:Aminoglycoside phosphotransferase domain-containing protein n=1 Tax=Dichomitus squalens TaxID=114155 RepID=A0A4Q9MZR4_9APHY|nr:hypothetical protein BD311DRAFT_784910 [Dichomitus squalens]